MLNLHIYPSNMQNESRVEKITASLVEKGIVDDIILVGKEDKTLEEYETISEFIRVWRVPLNDFRFPLFNWKVRKVLRYIQWLCKIYRRFRKEKINLINCHSIFDLPLGVVLKKKNKKNNCKLIYDTHELETERSSSSGMFKKVLRLIEKFFIEYSDHIFVVSDSIGEWYKEAYGLENISVVKNIPLKREFIKGSDKLRERFKIPAERILYIFQGGFHSDRGIEMLLSVFSKPDITDHIVFMGFGHLEEEIKAFEKEHTNIHFHEAVPVDQLLEYTTSADIGFSLTENVCLNHYYSLPNKIFEYVMSGIPCIASDFPDMGGFIKKHNCGWTTLPEEAGVYVLVKKISMNEVKEKKASIENLLKREDFGWQSEKKKLEAVYRNL